MSGDLISRRELLEELKDFCMLITGSANAMALTIMEETKKSIMRIVDEQPIIYNVDTVIEKIKGLQTFYLNSVYTTELNEHKETRHYVCLEDVLDIIQKKKDKPYLEGKEIPTLKKPIEREHFKFYCPTCNKDIEIFSSCKHCK